MMLLWEHLIGTILFRLNPVWWTSISLSNRGLIIFISLPVLFLYQLLSNQSYNSNSSSNSKSTIIIENPLPQLISKYKGSTHRLTTINVWLTTRILNLTLIRLPSSHLRKETMKMSTMSLLIRSTNSWTLHSLAKASLIMTKDWTMLLDLEVRHKQMHSWAVLVKARLVYSRTIFNNITTF